MYMKGIVRLKTHKLALFGTTSRGDTYPAGLFVLDELMARPQQPSDRMYVGGKPDTNHFIFFHEELRAILLIRRSG
jgi:hypothetical protein